MPKPRQRKSNTQSQNYHKILKQTNNDSINTIGYEYNQNLQGSNEICEILGQPDVGTREKVEPKSLKYQVIDWWKNHAVGAIISIIITSMVIPFVYFTITNIFSLQKDTAVLNEKTENLKTTLSQIQTNQNNYVDKQTLDLKLEIVQTQIKNMAPNDVSEIKQELDQIEKKIGTMK